ncbi:MAG: hypothetical protein JWM84_2667, partial [Nocardioides sp.]|nr:hypothetical protein [Nocardioides sp.]
LSARTLVGWYNAQPEIAADTVDLGPASLGRAVIVGNGNVALDMARILLCDPSVLVDTDIAQHALEALRASSVTEVVLVARRGPEEAAYSLSELRPLLALPGLDVAVDGGPALAALVAAATSGSKAAALQGVPVAPIDWTSPPPPAGADARRRLVLRFDSVVDRIEGDSRVEAVQLGESRIPTSLVVRSVGYRSEPLPGLPFDEATHTVPHEAGRVLDPATGAPIGSTYVVGWIKRGPRGGIGSNRADATETVGSLVIDANACRTSVGRGSPRSFRKLVRARPSVERRARASVVETR